MFAYSFNSTQRQRAPEEGIFSSGIRPQQWIKLLLMLMKLLSFKAIFIREGDFFFPSRKACKETVGAVKRQQQHRSMLYS